MVNFDYKYELQEAEAEQGLRLFFVSTGNQDIVKAIQYSFIQKLRDKDVYNLGFGDYDMDSGNIIDIINSNNGDARKVFNTVLSTIPSFFERYENAILMVQGSDGRPGFIENCKQTCVKGCVNDCKYYNRRIALYRRL